MFGASFFTTTCVGWKDHCVDPSSSLHHELTWKSPDLVPVLGLARLWRPTPSMGRSQIGFMQRACCVMTENSSIMFHPNKYLIIIRRKHLESADMQRFMDSIADSELKDDRSIIHMSRLQSASPLAVRLAFHLSSKLHIVSFLGEGFVLSD